MPLLPPLCTQIQTVEGLVLVYMKPHIIAQPRAYTSQTPGGGGKQWRGMQCRSAVHAEGAPLPPPPATTPNTSKPSAPTPTPPHRYDDEDDKEHEQRQLHTRADERRQLLQVPGRTEHVAVHQLPPRFLHSHQPNVLK